MGTSFFDLITGRPEWRDTIVAIKIRYDFNWWLVSISINKTLKIEHLCDNSSIMGLDPKTHECPKCQSTIEMASPLIVDYMGQPYINFLYSNNNIRTVSETLSREDTFYMLESIRDDLYVVNHGPINAVPTTFNHACAIVMDGVTVLASKAGECLLCKTNVDPAVAAFMILNKTLKLGDIK